MALATLTDRSTGRAEADGAALLRVRPEVAAAKCPSLQAAPVAVLFAPVVVRLLGDLEPAADLGDLDAL